MSLTFGDGELEERFGELELTNSPYFSYKHLDLVFPHSCDTGVSQTSSASKPINKHRTRRQSSVEPVPPCLSPARPSSVAAVAEDGRGVGGRGSGLGSPIGERHATSGNRKRNASLAGLDSSPGTIESPEADGSDDGQQHDDRRKQPVKRACNECRQQKVSNTSIRQRQPTDLCMNLMLSNIASRLTQAQLRCDVVQEPFQRCSRCNRLRLECKIENNFKRVGKRSRNAEMEKEIADLKRQLARQKAANTNKTHAGSSGYASTVPIDQWNGSHEAVAGLLDLRSGVDSSTGLPRSPSGQLLTGKRLENVFVTNERVIELFQRRVAYVILMTIMC